MLMAIPGPYQARPTRRALHGTAAGRDSGVPVPGMASGGGGGGTTKAGRVKLETQS